MKLPLAFSLKNRDDTTDKDARVLNGYVEIRKNRKGKVESLRTYKRPALDSAFELSAGTGQALYVPTSADGTNDVPGVVIGDILTRSPTPVTKRLSFSVQPSQSNLNTAISPSVVVQALNSIGGVVSGFTSVVTMSLGTNPTSATLGGTVTTAAVSGVATFSNLQLNRSGDDFTLRAVAANINSATSRNFDIPTRLVFTVQPSGSEPNTTLDPVEVTAQDLGGNTDTAYNGSITIALYSGPGTLSGTTTVSAVSGVASFTNLEISAAGTYSLVVVGSEVSTAYPPTKAVSNSFSIVEPTHTVTAIQFQYGSDPGNITRYGYDSRVPAGSITPTTYNGVSVVGVLSTLDSGSDLGNTVVLNGNLAQSFFTSITINGTTLTTASADTYTPGAVTLWYWNTTNLITSSGTYPIAIV